MRTLRLLCAVLFCGLIQFTHSEISCIDKSDGRAFQALRGQAVILSVSSLSYSSDTGQCDKVTSEVEILEAVRWTLKRLNEDNFMPSINFGLVAVDSCTESSKVVDSTLRVLREFEGGNCPCGMEDRCKMFGILGPERSSHAHKLSSVLGTLPPESQYIQMAYETTAKDLNDSLKYPNFFRVIPTDDLQVMAISKLLVDLKSNYFAIIYQNDNYGKGAAMELKLLAEDSGLCVSEFTSIPPGASSSELFRVAHNYLVRIPRIDCIVYIGSPVTANLLLNYFSGKDKKSYTDNLNFIFSDAIGLQPKYMKYGEESNQKSVDVALGSLTLSPPYSEISEFSTYWRTMFKNITRLKDESLQNPFLLSLYKELKQCDPDTQECPPLTDVELDNNFKQNVFVKYAIEATFALAYLFRDIHGHSCSAGELCTSLQNELPSAFGKRMAELSSISLLELRLPETRRELNFDANGDMKDTPGSVQYEIFNYKECQNTHCFEKVADLKNGNLYPADFRSAMSSYTYDYVKDVWSEKSYPSSQCPSDTAINCAECISETLPDEYYYADGDYIIVGVAPIYTEPTGSEKCGELYDTTGASLGEAIAYAIEDVQKSNIFPGKTIGFIIINSCNRGVIVQEKIFSIMGGQSPLGDISGKLIGFIGELGSIISLAMSNPVTELKYVQVGYGSTSSKLSDRSDHPYFMRVCTSDDKQAEAIVRVITEMEVDAIQVVFQNEAYGRGGNLSIARAIANMGNKICVVRVHEVTEHDNFFTVLTRLRETSYAKVVVVFLRINVMTAALKAFNNMAPGEFLIFGSEAWGKRPLILEDNPNLIGSMTASMEMAFDTNFDDYMGKLRPALKNRNPWLLDVLEKRLQCYYPQSFNKAKYTKECDESKGYTDAPNYLQETWVPFVIRAVQALCIGVSKSINDKCDGNSYCDALRLDPKIITEEMKKIKFDLFASGDQTNLFDSNGDGNVGYKMYNIQKDTAPGKSKYVDVGQWSVDGFFSFRSELMVYPGEKDSIESNCPNDATCKMCPGTGPDHSTASPSTTGTSDSFMVPVLGALCGVFFLVLIILVIVICCLRKRQKETDYLTPTRGHHPRNPAFSQEVYSQPEVEEEFSSVGTQNKPHHLIATSAPNVAAPRAHDGGSAGSGGSGNRYDADGGLW